MPPDGSTVVLFKDDTKKEVFLVFRSDYPIWGTTGGAIEKNETPEEAALREAYEETGFKTKITKYCGTYQLTYNKLHLYEGRIISANLNRNSQAVRESGSMLISFPKIWLPEPDVK